MRFGWPPIPVSDRPQQVSGVAAQWSLGLRFSPSLFLLQPGPTSNHPPLPPPFLSSTAMFWQLSLEMSIKRAQSGPLEQTQGLDLGPLCTICLPQAWLLPHPCSGHPGPAFTSRALVSHVLETSCLDRSLHSHLRYSLRRPGISTCSP